MLGALWLCLRAVTLLKVVLQSDSTCILADLLLALLSALPIPLDKISARREHDFIWAVQSA